MLLTRNSPPPVPFPFQTLALPGIRQRKLVVVAGGGQEKELAPAPVWGDNDK